MKLTEAQISGLFRFTEKKFVRWYDLQLEIVDHLATAIETEMEADSKLSFEAALERVYGKFGIFGFARIVKEKQKQLESAANRLWWSEFRSLLGWPQLIKVALIVSAAWTIAVSIPKMVLWENFLLLYMIGPILQLVHLIRDHRARQKLLLLQFGAESQSAIFIFDIIFFSALPWWIPLGALEFTIVASISFIIRLTSVQLYHKVRKQALNLYPAAFVK